MPPPGGIIQIQYGQSTTRAQQAISGQTYTKLTAFPSATITPLATTSKMMIDVMWNGEFSNVNNTWDTVFVLYRDDTLLKGHTTTANAAGMFTATTSFQNVDDDSTAESMHGRYFDEPNTTSEITYYLGIRTQSGDDNFTINGVVNSNTGNNYERFISNITVTEIAG